MKAVTMFFVDVLASESMTDNLVNTSDKITSVYDNLACVASHFYFTVLNCTSHPHEICSWPR